MLNRKIQHNKQELTLFKGRNQYKKVVKEMSKPPSDYEAIKTLVESNNNSITHVQQKDINIKSKNTVEMKSHNKLKK